MATAMLHSRCANEQWIIRVSVTIALHALFSLSNMHTSHTFSLCVSLSFLFSLSQTRTCHSLSPSLSLFSLKHAHITHFLSLSLCLSLCLSLFSLFSLKHELLSLSLSLFLSLSPVHCYRFFSRVLFKDRYVPSPSPTLLYFTQFIFSSRKVPPRCASLPRHLSNYSPLFRGYLESGSYILPQLHPSTTPPTTSNPAYIYFHDFTHPRLHPLPGIQLIYFHDFTHPRLHPSTTSPIHDFTHYLESGLYV